MPRGVIASGGDLRVEVDQVQFRDLMAGIRRFSPALATTTRRNLRRVGDEMVRDMRARIMAGGGGKTSQAVARGIRTRVFTGARKQGVQISAAGPAPMSRLLNKSSWRHPVFGRRSMWVTQQGRPFFGVSIRGREAELREAVLDALDEALKAMRGV